MSFKRIMERAGIEAGVGPTKERRNVSKLSFHSLRHSFNSALANAGIPPEIRQLLTGHSSLEMTNRRIQTGKRAGFMSRKVRRLNV